MSDVLGMSHSKAQAKLRKSILFEILKLQACYRCKISIATIEEFSIDHKQPWLSATDPKAAFFDLNNIAFSHLKCNIKGSTGGLVTGAKQRAKTNCKYGHLFDEQNTRYSIQQNGNLRRGCRKCDRNRYCFISQNLRHKRGEVCKCQK